MIYKCKNCGGNMVYNPEKEDMYCPYCEGVGCETVQTGSSMVTCANCGAEVSINDYTSASKCPACDNYIVFDERVTGKYLPKMILPFKVTKNAAKTMIYNEFGKRAFTPSDFLSETSLKSMEGMYIPFWMYNFDANYEFQGEAVKRRVWTTGSTEYTETSYYLLNRNMDIDFRRIPVDASLAMEDDVMDLMEPYQYQDLTAFDPKYMSGFFGEVYNEDAAALEPRAAEKVKADSEQLLNASMTGYSSIVPAVKKLTTSNITGEYSLLPVWMYLFKYHDKVYKYHVNGQTGKVIGETPVSKGKVWGYSITTFALTFSIICMVLSIVGVM